MNKIIALGCVLALLWSTLATVDGVLYEVLLNSFEAIPQEIDDMMDYGTIRLTRQGKNQLGVSGSFTVYKNAGSETQIRWAVYKVDFMGQKRMFVNGAGSLCQIIAKDEVIYPQLLESSNLPPQDACPFPKGNYTIFNYVFDENKLPPAVPASEWLMEAIVSRNGQVGGGFRTYQILFEYLNYLPSKYDDVVDFGTLRMKKVGPNKCVITGSIMLFQNFGDEVTVSGKLFRKASGTGGVPYFAHINTFCKMLVKDVLIYPQLLEHSNFPPQGTCPITKGNYTVDNFLVDLKKLPQVVPYGEWLLQLEYIRGNEVIAALEFYFTILP
uniref:MD-2-related lipid-recognition domain-containing protein n=1 Tax=Anopheles dirus TaxID=7168 RepID=A0A182NQW2_9DIPT